ncbi:MAG: hypothetical protein JST55_15095 [Bacteroidetes bacterium]|nr:hypothetical protein [Bacteroidota bacterium]
MKKYLKYILTASIFTAHNLFAQSAADTEGMDMSSYATWMGTGFLVMLFVMIAVFLINGNKDTSEAEAGILQSSVIVVRNKINTAIGSSLQLLNGISIDLQRVRFLLASALIMFSTILLLLIIQK